MRRSSASRRLPRLARPCGTTNRARSFFPDWYPYATTPFRDTGESTVHDWTNIVTSFDARMDVLFHLVSPRSHEVARRPPPPSPRAPHPRARDVRHAPRIRGDARDVRSRSRRRGPPRGVPTGVFWVARTGGPLEPTTTHRDSREPPVACAGPSPRVPAVDRRRRFLRARRPRLRPALRPRRPRRRRARPPVRLGGPRRDGRVGGGAPRRQPRTRRCSPRRRAPPRPRRPPRGDRQTVAPRGLPRPTRPRCTPPPR